MTSCIAIDDDPLYIKLLSSFFAEIKTAKLVATYTNPVEGVMGVVKQKPAILLLDLDMPYLDGLEALETLDNKPKVIVISGNSTLDPTQIKVDRFIQKSELSSAKVLEDAINSLLG